MLSLESRLCVAANPKSCGFDSYFDGEDDPERLSFLFGSGVASPSRWTLVTGAEENSWGDARNTKARS